MIPSKVRPKLKVVHKAIRSNLDPFYSQANTVKHKRALSWHFLGMRYWQTKRFEIPITEMKAALKWLKGRLEELNWKTLKLDDD